MYRNFITLYGWIFPCLYSLHFVYPFHSSVGRYLGCFFFGAVMNKATTNTDKYLFESLFSILWGIHLGIELLGHFEEQEQYSFTIQKHGHLVNTRVPTAIHFWIDFLPSFLPTQAPGNDLISSHLTLVWVLFWLCWHSRLLVLTIFQHCLCT